MREDNTLYHLDKTLEWFTRHPDDWNKNPIADRSSVTRPTAYELIANDMPELNTKEYDSYKEDIFKKLEKDGYIQARRASGLETKFSSTFEGIIFNRQGGYRGDLKYRGIQIRRARRNEIMLIVGSIGAALAGLALFVMEVLKFCRYCK